jgi:hypothetical protein
MPRFWVATKIIGRQTPKILVEIVYDCSHADKETL